MKILYITDIHGDKDKYEKVIELAKRENVDAVINGGDILPKLDNRMTHQFRFIRNYLEDYFKKLNEEEIEYYVMLGNDDLEYLDSLFAELCEQFPNVHNMAQSKHKLGDYEVIGMNYILDTPFTQKERVISEDNFSPDFEILQDGVKYINGVYTPVTTWPEMLKTLPKMKDVLKELPEPKDQSKTIYIIHEPPKGLNLGMVGSTGCDIGSVDLLDFIKEKQPRFTFHGHIHESPEVGGEYYKEVGNTICIQPGQSERYEKDLIYVLVDLDNKTFSRKREAVK